MLQKYCCQKAPLSSRLASRSESASRSREMSNTILTESAIPIGTTDEELICVMRSFRQKDLIILANNGHLNIGNLANTLVERRKLGLERRNELGIGISDEKPAITVETNTQSRLNIQNNQLNATTNEILNSSSAILVAPQQLSWQILPPGEHITTNVINYYRQLARKQGTNHYDMKRLATFLSLRPIKCFQGIQDMNGYVIFFFGYTENFCFESPVYGNASYVLSGNWEELSKCTKRELIEHPTALVDRIYHRGDWKGRLKAALK